MSRRSIALNDDLYTYLCNVSLREPEILGKLREETSYLAEAEMQIAAEEGQLLGLLLQLMGARRCIEIGVFTGYSTLWAALSLPEDGYLIACENNPAWQEIAERHWQEAGVQNIIDLRLTPAIQTLEALIAEEKDGWFDFAFIDADKQSYDQYYELCLKLLRPGGLVALDNVLRGGRVTNPDIQDTDTMAIRSLNRKISSDKRVMLSMLPIGDGLTLAIKL